MIDGDGVVGYRDRTGALVFEWATETAKWRVTISQDGDSGRISREDTATGFGRGAVVDADGVTAIE